jgi:iron complex outermembrane receptor protein
VAADETFPRTRYAAPLGAALKTGASAVLMMLASPAAAQDTQAPQQSEAAPSSQPLPPVVVQSSPRPVQKIAAKPKRKTKSTQKTISARPVGSSAPTQPTGPVAAPETATSPVKGIVAKVSGTATKTDTPLLQTPQSVSVVTREQMDQQGAQSVSQALQYTSGVAANTRTAFSGFDLVYSRGFILDRFLDGLKYPSGSNYTAPQLELYGLERLEVLHGPASMLYGASSPGGIINAISKRPTDEPYHEIELTFGNFDHIEAAFDFGGPITTDGKWSYRLSGLARDFDSQVDFNEQERYWLAPALTWKPVTGTTITFLANIQHDPNVGLYNQIPYYGSVDTSIGRIPRHQFLGEPDYNTNRRDQQSVGYALESHLDDTWTVRQNLRYMHVNGDVNQFLPLPLDSGGGLFGTELYRYVVTQSSDADSFAVDTNAEAKFWTGPLAHKFIFGVDYQRFQEKASVNLEGAFNPIDIFNPVYGDLARFPFVKTDSNQVLNQTGIYVQDQIAWDRLILTLGAREDFSQITTLSQVTSEGVTVPDNSSNDDNHHTERFGVTYLLDGGWAPYASYATSFQPLAGLNAITGVPLVPTTGQQYEVGLKYAPPGHNALFTFAAYDLTQQNVVTDNGITLEQIGEVRSRGVEAEAKISATKNIDLIASYSYVDAEITKSLNQATLGKRPVNIPNQTAALWGFYTFHEGSLNGFGLGGGVRYIGNSAGSDDNSLIVPDYTLFDLAAQYDFSKLSPRLNGMSVRLNVINVGDRLYVSQCTNEVTCVYGNGRTILTTLKYQW